MAFHIPFNYPHMTGKELYYIAEAHFGGKLAGDGPFSLRCHQWLENYTGCVKALLTHSCTAALEMQSLLLDLKAGDEVIMPSYTFVSTANAVVLRGGVPVFIDIREDTLNIDETLVEAAITSKTRAIAPVHYAGVGCEMDALMEIAAQHGLKIIEDAAQGFMATYKGRTLGSLGHMGAFSFHETKNVISGEGGALLINDEELRLKAEVIREKGTDRSRFFRGEVDKYTWQEVGSSYLPGEVVAAFLLAQLEQADQITTRRLQLWQMYHTLLADAEMHELLRRPIIPNYCQHNAHMYYVLLPSHVDRQKLTEALKHHGIHAVFHYIPLHSSPAGQRYGRSCGNLDHTDRLSAQLLRLPLYVDMTTDQLEYVADTLIQFLKKNRDIEN